MNERKMFSPGDIVQHFKRELITGDKGTKYLYEIIGFAQHTETGEVTVIYKSLYDHSYIGTNTKLCSRPLDMFMSKVDHNKYPNINQKYRFELYI